MGQGLGLLFQSANLLIMTVSSSALADVDKGRTDLSSFRVG